MEDFIFIYIIKLYYYMITEYLHLFSTRSSFAREKKNNYHEPWVSVTLAGGGGEVRSFKIGSDISCIFTGEFYQTTKRIYQDSLGRKYILYRFNGGGYSANTLGYLEAMLLKEKNGYYYGDVENGLFDMYDVIYDNSSKIDYNLNISEEESELVDSPENDEIWYTTNNGLPIDKIVSNTNNSIMYYDGNNIRPITISEQYVDGDHIVVKLSSEIPANTYSYMLGVSSDSYDTWFKDCPTLTGIAFPPNLNAIAYRAFDKCSNLTSIVFPSNLIYIGPRAFEECTSLKNVILPNGVKALAYGAFRMCYSLESIYLPESLTTLGYRNTYYNFESSKSVDYFVDDGLDLYGGVFQDDDLLDNIVLPSNLNTIGENTFSSCSSLSIIDIPASVTEIGDTSFAGCESLNIATVSTENSRYTSRNSNGEECNCIYDKLQGILIFGSPSTVPMMSDLTLTEIGPHAFDGRSGMTAIDIPLSITKIGGASFHMTGLTSIYIHKNITSIDSWSFFHCKDLAEIKVDPLNSVYSSQDPVTGAECNCIWHKANHVLVVGCMNTTIPSGIVGILSGAFNNHQKLTTLTLPTSIKYIGYDNTFNGCIALNTVNYAGTTSQYIANVGRYDANLYQDGYNLYYAFQNFLNCCLN